MSQTDIAGALYTALYADTDNDYLVKPYWGGGNNATFKLPEFPLPNMGGEDLYFSDSEEEGILESIDAEKSDDSASDSASDSDSPIEFESIVDDNSEGAPISDVVKGMNELSIDYLNQIR